MSAFTISSNNAVTGTSGAYVEVYTAVAAPNDGYAEITYGSAVDPTTDSGVGPMYRVSTTAETGYLAQGNTVQTRIYKVVAGVFTQLGLDGPAIAAGNVLRLICNGTSISATKDGTTIITATDAAIASGGAGMWGGPTQIDSISLFAFGDLAGGAIPDSERTSVTSPALRLGTPRARLRGFYNDVPAVSTVIENAIIGAYSWAGTTATVASLAPDSEQNSLSINLLIGTPHSRLRGFYDDTPPPPALISGIVGSYSWAGTTATASGLINEGIAAYSWTGTTAGTSQLINSDGGANAYSWAGTTAGLAQNISGSVGAYSWAGTTATLSGPINASTGSYLWAGTTSGVSTGSQGQSPVFRRHAFRPRSLSS
jgi:hypothetical protein